MRGADYQINVQSTRNLVVKIMADTNEKMLDISSIAWHRPTKYSLRCDQNLAKGGSIVVVVVGLFETATNTL